MKKLFLTVTAAAFLLATVFGYEVTERCRLGAVVESITYISNGPLAGKVALVDGWSVYIHDPVLGTCEKSFSTFGMGFIDLPRGIAYLSQGDFAGHFLLSDSQNPNTLYLITVNGALAGTAHAQGFQWFGAEGLTQITSGPDQGKIAMIAHGSTDSLNHIYIYRLEQSGSEINAYLEKDLLNVPATDLLGIAYLPTDFPDPAYADMFAVSDGEDSTPLLYVVDGQGTRVATFPGFTYPEGLTYISSGAQAGKMLMADSFLLHPVFRNLDGSTSIPSSIPTVGIGLNLITNFTWLKERQQFFVLQWDGRNFNQPVSIISRPGAGAWRQDSQFRLTHFRSTRNITAMAADGNYRLFGSITPIGVPVRFEVDVLDRDLNLLGTTALPSQYTGLAFGTLAYVPGETPADDRYVAPVQKSVYSFDPLFSYPAAITDISGLVTSNITKLSYDPAVRRYYVLDGTFLRVFDASWNPIDAFNLLDVSPGPFRAIDKITSGDLKGNFAVLNYSDDELIALNIEDHITGDLLDREINEILDANLPNGTANSLTNKLENAKESINKKHYTPAMNQVEAFMNEVRAQSGKKIPTATADRWLALAADILRGLEQFL